MQSMYEKTLVLVRKDKRTARQIADAADVNRHWLAKFRQGKATNPTLENLEKLYDYLSKAKPGRRIAKAQMSNRSAARWPAP